MAYARKYLILPFFLLMVIGVKAQPDNPPAFCRLYGSNSFIQDKNFYFFTLLEKMPAINRLLAADTGLQHFLQRYQAYLAKPDRGKGPEGITAPMQFSPEQVIYIHNYLPALLSRYPAERQQLLDAMRCSGRFQRYAADKDAVLLDKAWADAAAGINYIIHAYTTNTGFRYPAIDGAAWNVASPAYRQATDSILKRLAASERRAVLFFQPSLHLATALLQVNKHDEAARYEPLAATNREAYTQWKQTDWDKYTYTALVILGAGPDNKDAISEAGKQRCRLGATLYRQGAAPCIIVSGGHVHPFGTPYAEAVEMKKYLVHELNIPADAVLLEPYARHTTTNLRNAVRIAAAGNVPLNRPMLCVSDAMHLTYVKSPMFATRCVQELGYVPVKNMQPAAGLLSFIPDNTSLHADARDPLDP